MVKQEIRTLEEQQAATEKVASTPKPEYRQTHFDCVKIKDMNILQTNILSKSKRYVPPVSPLLYPDRLFFTTGLILLFPSLCNKSS